MVFIVILFGEDISMIFWSDDGSIGTLNLMAGAFVRNAIFDCMSLREMKMSILHLGG